MNENVLDMRKYEFKTFQNLKNEFRAQHYLQSLPSRDNQFCFKLLCFYLINHNQDKQPSSDILCSLAAITLCVIMSVCPPP